MLVSGVEHIDGSVFLQIILRLNPSLPREDPQTWGIPRLFCVGSDLVAFFPPSLIPCESFFTALAV